VEFEAGDLGEHSSGGKGRGSQFMSEITNPHDRFFKEMFSRTEVAEDFVRHYLPPELSAALAPNSFKLRKDSFVNEELREHLSDLLYEVDFKQGQSGLVFILFEHKSFPQDDVAVQLLDYMTGI
jgi:predicted transposase/invertase (TIGR01784 family)